MRCNAGEISLFAAALRDKELFIFGGLVSFTNSSGEAQYNTCERSLVHTAERHRSDSTT